MLDSKAGRSPARDRGVRTFFADLQGEAGAVRVCDGLSCHLAGRPGWQPGPGVPVRSVHCLGYCDRAPAVLLPDGQVRLGTAAGLDPARVANGPPPAPAIRAIAGEAIVTARVSRGDHSRLDVARHAQVYGALTAAVARPPAEVLAAVADSGEQGRGGAGLPTGRKWQLAAAAPGPIRYVVANGDEGDAGSFIDRILLEQDPHAVLEGLALCAYAIGAAEGIVYIRSEYPAARAVMEAAIAEARAAGLLGATVAGAAFAFDARVVSGHGSYVCGEETALLNAIEGRRGEVRVRPPYPTEQGLHGRPTVVNNIETLVNIPWIVRHGGAAFRKFGTRASPGTKAFCFSQGFASPGIVEAEFGVSLRSLVEDIGGGGRGGVPLAGVALGGPMGSILLPHEWDLPVDYPEMAAHGVRLGHGGLVALPAGTDFHDLLVHWLAFMAAESCGKCVPCRLGSARALAAARQLGPGLALEHEPATRDRAHAALRELLVLIGDTSLCGFGQSLPAPIERLRSLAQAAAGGARR